MTIDSNDLHEEYAELDRLVLYDQRYDEAEPRLHMLLEQATVAQDKSMQAKCLNHLAVCHESTRRVGDAELFLRKAESLYLETGEIHALLGIYGNLANIYSYQGKREEAKEHYRKSLELAVVTSPKDHAITLSNYGAYLSEDGLFEEALKLLRQSNEIARIHGPKALLVHNLILIAEFYMRLKEYEESVRCCNEALELVKSVGRPEERGRALFNRSRAKCALGLLTEALEDAEEATRILGQINVLNFYAQALHVLADSELKLGRTTEAEAHLRESLSIFGNIDDATGPIDAYCTLGRLLMMRDELNEALVVMTKVEEMIETMAAETLRGEVHELMIELHKARSDHKTALIYAEKLLEWERKAQKKLSRQALDELRLHYEISRVEAEGKIAALKAESIEIELRERTKLLSHRLRLLVSTQQAQAVVLLRLEGKVRNHASSAQVLMEVKRLIREQNVTARCIEAEHEFDLLHPHFKSRLSEEFTGITTMQLRLCSFFRLGMSVADTATLLSLSERNIENHRYRLRKLFDLRTEEKLSDFLQKF